MPLDLRAGLLKRARRGGTLLPLMDPAPLSVRYSFRMRDGSVREEAVQLDPTSLADVAPVAADGPGWTLLAFERCPNCPLPAATGARCPAAARLAPLAAAFGETLSVEDCEAEVEISGRTVGKRLAAAPALGSLLGLKFATSGCPILGRLRPMARFHVPFADETETLYRAAGLYLIAQHLRATTGEPPDWSLSGLVAIYEDVGRVNQAFAKRLRAAGKADANVNALVHLDMFAKWVPASILDRLEDLRELLAVWVAG